MFKQTSGLFSLLLKSPFPTNNQLLVIFFYILFLMHKAGCSFPRTNFTTKNVSPNFRVKSNKEAYSGAEINYVLLLKLVKILVLPAADL